MWPRVFTGLVEDDSTVVQSATDKETLEVPKQRLDDIGDSFDEVQTGENIYNRIMTNGAGPHTMAQVPFDPNLVCPQCDQQFKLGEIQKFKKHTDNCTGPTVT